MNNRIVTDSKATGAASAIAMQPSTRPDQRTIAALLSPRFAILRLLEQSGDGAIYLARDRAESESAGRDCLVKLKVICEQTPPDRRKIELFYLETRAAARLSHKNIIRTWEPEQIENLHFCAIEHRAECESLRDLLNLRAWLDAKLAAGLALQISEALEYAQSQGVMHLKLRPESILVDPNGEALIADFGIEDKEELRWARDERAQTQPAIYCSPEQASEKELDSRSDLYSLGIILHEMLTDRVPFDHPDPNMVRHKHRTQTPEPPNVFRPDLPPPAIEAVMRLLEKNPDQRPQSHAQLRDVLSGIIQDRKAPQTAASSLNDPVGDALTDEEPLAVTSLQEEESANSIAGDEFPLESAFPNLQEDALQIGWDDFARVESEPAQRPHARREFSPETQSIAEPKRARFEPPTITVIDPPEFGAAGIGLVSDNSARVGAIEEDRAREEAPSGMMPKLFLMLALIIVAALALILTDPASSLKSLRNQAPATPPAEATRMEDTTQPANAISDSAEKPSPVESEPPASKAQTSGLIKSSAEGDAARSFKRKAVRKAQPRIKNYRAARASNWNRWRAR